MAAMASMACFTLSHTLLSPLLRAKPILGPVHLRSTGASGNCTHCRLRYRKSSRVRGLVDEEGTSSSEETCAAPVNTELDNSTSNGTSASNSVENRKAAARAEVQRGQNTAVITGAISVLLGVAYLVLLQLLDTRGIELIPPPPEAFDP